LLFGVFSGQREGKEADADCHQEMHNQHHPITHHRLYCETATPRDDMPAYSATVTSHRAWSPPEVASEHAHEPRTVLTLRRVEEMEGQGASCDCCHIMDAQRQWQFLDDGNYADTDADADADATEGSNFADTDAERFSHDGSNQLDLLCRQVAVSSASVV